MLAQEIHEGAMLLPWVATPGMDAQFGPDVYTLWDLDEMDFKPPRSAEYEEIVSHATWTQTVAVRHVSLEDPSTVVDPLTFEGDTLVELVVQVAQNNKEYGQFSWWMTEPEHDTDV